MHRVFFSHEDEKTYSNNLPEKAEHKMGLPFRQVVGINIDNITTDSLRRKQSQSEIFMFRVKRQVFLVDCSFVDGVRTRMVDYFAENKNKTEHKLED